MTENETQETQPSQEPVAGQQPTETTPVIQAANEAAASLKTENDRKEQLLIREEAIQARNALGGTAEAGEEPAKPKEETPQDYAKRVMEGKL